MREAIRELQQWARDHDWMVPNTETVRSAFRNHFDADDLSWRDFVKYGMKPMARWCEFQREIAERDARDRAEWADLWAGVWI